MVTETIACPHCHQAGPVYRFGYNRDGTQRLRCKDCNKTFTPRRLGALPQWEQAQRGHPTITPTIPGSGGNNAAETITILLIADRTYSRIHRNCEPKKI